MQVIVLALLVLSGNFAVHGNSYKFASIKCHDLTEVFLTEKCTHNDSVLNVVTQIKEPLNKIHILISFHKFDQMRFRQIFKINRIEWCAFMAGATKLNYMLKFVLSAIKESASQQLFHKCPYQGKVEIVNKALKEAKLISIYPPGLYRLDVKVSNEATVMFNVELELEIF